MIGDLIRLARCARYVVALLLAGCGGAVDVPDADAPDAAADVAPETSAPMGTSCVGVDASVAMGDPACFEFTDEDGGLHVCQPCPVGHECASVAFGWVGVCQ